jgi:hypothetical protein
MDFLNFAVTTLLAILAGAVGYQVGLQQLDRPFLTRERQINEELRQIQDPQERLEAIMRVQARMSLRGSCVDRKITVTEASTGSTVTAPLAEDGSFSIRLPDPGTLTLPSGP